jgi:hypothetical protein
MSPPASKRKAAPPARARSLLTAAALAIIAYAASAAEPAWSLLALACSALAVLVTSPLVGITVPRAVTGLATLGVLLLTLSRAADNGLDVHDFAGFVVWMIVVKCFDRRTAGDDAQLLAFAIFLAVASMLLSNGLVVAMLTLVFLPFVAYAAMHLQLRVSRDRAQRLARHKAADPARVPGIRPASGPATGAALARTSVIALGVGFMFAALVFVVVPRGAGLRQLGRLGNPSAGRVVSFTDRVRVGAGGAIATSRTPVLHLRVTDADGRDLGGVGAVRYLRGAVLEDYEDGTWTVSHTPARDGQIDEFLAEQSKSFGTGSSNSIITQELLLLNTPREFTYLFTLWRPNDIRVGDPCTVAVYSPHGSIMAATNGGKFRYTVRSSQADPYATRARARSPTGWPSPHSRAHRRGDPRPRRNPPRPGDATDRGRRPRHHRVPPVLLGQLRVQPRRAAAAARRRTHRLVPYPDRPRPLRALRRRARRPLPECRDPRPRGHGLPRRGVHPRDRQLHRPREQRPRVGGGPGRTGDLAHLRRHPAPGDHAPARAEAGRPRRPRTSARRHQLQVGQLHRLVRQRRQGRPAPVERARDRRDLRQGRRLLQAPPPRRPPARLSCSRSACSSS